VGYNGSNGLEQRIHEIHTSECQKNFRDDENEKDSVTPKGKRMKGKVFTTNQKGLENWLN